MVCISVHKLRVKLFSYMLSNCCRYLANGGTFCYSNDEERLAASSSDFAPWAERAKPPVPADGGSPFHFVCETFFMTAAVLHVGAGQLIESMQTSQREYEHLLQQGPLARQDLVCFPFPLATTAF